MKTDILKLGFGQNPTRRTDPTSAPIFTWKVLIYNKKNKAVACPRPPNVIRCLTFVPMILTSENWVFFWFVGFLRFQEFCHLMLLKPCNIQWFWYQRSVVFFLGNLTMCTEFLKYSWCVPPVPQMGLLAYSPSQVANWDLIISHISTCLFICLYPGNFTALHPWGIVHSPSNYHYCFL